MGYRIPVRYKTELGFKTNAVFECLLFLDTCSCQVPHNPVNVVAYIDKTAQKCYDHLVSNKFFAVHREILLPVISDNGKGIAVKRETNIPISFASKKRITKGDTAMMIGEKAPEFTLLDQEGNPVSLSDFLGQKVVLYFYAKDNTPGCTRQACAFASAYEAFRRKNVQLIGISKDSVKSHAAFAAKYHLPFILLSDPERKAIEAYGVWQEKKIYGNVSMGVVRTTFLIDENGNICKIMSKVKPDTNASDILAEL